MITGSAAPFWNKIQNLRTGPAGVRDLLSALGYAYVNELLQVPNPLNKIVFVSSPRLVACACDGEFKVILICANALSNATRDKICRQYSQRFPYSLFLFTNDRFDIWQFMLPSLHSEDAENRAFHFSLENLTDSTLLRLARLEHEEQTSQELHDRLREVLTEVHLTSLREQVEAKSSDSGWQDTVTWWLKIAGSYPMLNYEQEIELAKRITTGGPDGEAARDELVQANLRLSIWMARKYQNRGLAISDLIQEANLGLFHAAEKYNSNFGCRFSTYATQWCRQALGRAVENQGRTIRLPSHAIESLCKIKRTREMLSTRLCREPVPDEIAWELNMPVSKIEALLKLEASEPMSLDAPAGESTTQLAELLPAEDDSAPLSRILRSTLFEEIARALSQLQPREREVLSLRYGLDSEQSPMTLEQVGTTLHLSRERARQIEAMALQNLRRGEIGALLDMRIVGKDSASKPVKLIVPVQKALLVKFGPDAQISDFAKLSFQEVRDLPGIGPVKVDYIRQRLKLAGLTFRQVATKSMFTEIEIHPSTRMHCRETTKKLKTCHKFGDDELLIPSIQKALLARFGPNAQFSDFVKLSTEEVQNLPGIGGRKIEYIRRLLALKGLTFRSSVVELPTEAKVILGVLPASVCVPSAELKEDDNAELPLTSPIQQQFAFSEATPMPPKERITMMPSSCQSCGADVKLKPSFKSQWYRCRACGDTRLVTP